MKNKVNIFVTILLMTIAFATISTTIYINGTTSIKTNSDGLDVYFSYAEMDSLDMTDSIISLDKKTIDFTTTNLIFEGQTTLLKYNIKNDSNVYDADYVISCGLEVGAEEYISFSNSLINGTLKALEEKTGTLTITLKKAVVNEKEFHVNCEITANATERDELATTTTTTTRPASYNATKSCTTEDRYYCYDQWYDEYGTWQCGGDWRHYDAEVCSYTCPNGGTLNTTDNKCYY